MTRTLRAVVLLPSVLCAAFALHANISFTITHEHCANGLGVVQASVTGGVPPYTYNWSNGANTQNLVNVPAGSYTLTVTDNLGAEQVATAVVENRLNWEWDPDPESIVARAIPSCMPGPEPNSMGYVFFGNDWTIMPAGPPPHQFDHSCMNGPFDGNVPADWNWFITGLVQATCFFALPGETYAVNYTDANGCPGYMEAVVPQEPQFFPISILDIEGSCSGGANGRVRFSMPPEPDYIYGMRPHLYNPDGEENWNFYNYYGTNWTSGATYDVPDLAAGTYSLVRRMTLDPMFEQYFPCGDTTYFTIPDLGPTCGHVTGSVVVDVNEDCVFNGSDARIPEMILEFMPGPYYATTDAMGNYGINLPLGNYSVAQQTTVVDEHCLGDPVPLTVGGSMTFNLLDTALMAQDVQLTMASGPARPGFELNYAIGLDDLTSATSQLNDLVMTFDPSVSYIAATPTPSGVVGNTITWTNLGSLYYFSHRDVNVRFQVPPDVGLIGMDLQATAQLTSSGDANTANNTASTITSVTGSYDPNDKTATTSSNLSRELYIIDADEWIDYTIRFQNTGTDTAFTVVVTDTLPAILDASAVTVGAGSHPFTWNLQGSGTLKCYFVNILLPDSTANEPASHGFVSFHVKPRLPLSVGTVIENVANIFFDFNDPVITEPSVLTAEFSTGVPVPVSEQLLVVPNPASDLVRVRVGEGSIALVRLVAMDGREVLRRSTGGNSASIELSSFAAGSYALIVRMTDGNEHRTVLNIIHR